MPDDITKTELLHESTQRLVRTVDSLPDAAFAEPSGLPDWTRAHVIAHLALNAEGLAGALTGLVQGEPTPMYSSPEARDADIAELAGRRAGRAADPAPRGDHGLRGRRGRRTGRRRGRPIERCPGA